MGGGLGGASGSRAAGAVGGAGTGTGGGVGVGGVGGAVGAGADSGVDAGVDAGADSVGADCFGTSNAQTVFPNSAAASAIRASGVIFRISSAKRSTRDPVRIPTILRKP